MPFFFKNLSGCLNCAAKEQYLLLLDASRSHRVLPFSMTLMSVSY